MPTSGRSPLMQGESRKDDGCDFLPGERMREVEGSELAAPRLYPTADTFIKWFLPWFLAGLGWEIQSIGLHFATYSYIHKYAETDKTADYMAANDYNTLKDVEDNLPQWSVNMHVIDAIAGLFPFLFVVASLAAPTLGAYRKLGTGVEDSKPPWRRKPVVLGMYHDIVLMVWSKIMFCASLMFCLKGILGAITTVPDSSGWEVCKARLKPEGIQWLRETHTFADIAGLDFYWMFTYHHPLRYCSDMMYSGHTFVVTLFALGLYELILVSNMNSILTTKLKIVLLALLSAATIGEQFVEIYVVEASHFHYSMDVLTALVLTFLFYTNGAINVASKRWVEVGSYLARGNFKEIRAKWSQRSKKLAKWKKQDVDAEQVADAKFGSKHVPEIWKHFVSRGDILIPWCCFPFCCLSGREHVYSDVMVEEMAVRLAASHEVAMRGAPKQTTIDDIESVIAEANDKNAKVYFQEMMEYLKAEMHIDEGVTLNAAWEEAFGPQAAV